jgi:hypothetical protein
MSHACLAIFCLAAAAYAAAALAAPANAAAAFLQLCYVRALPYLTCPCCSHASPSRLGARLQGAERVALGYVIGA